MVKKDIAGAVIILLFLLLVPFRTNGNVKHKYPPVNNLNASHINQSITELSFTNSVKYLSSEYSAGSQIASLCVNHFIDWGFGNRNRPGPIDVLVIHSTYNAGGGSMFSVEGVLDQFREEGVASHYLIDRGGKIINLVPDSIIAYHAGKSQLLDGRKNINYCSIGIELINTPGIHPDSSQYLSLNLLLERLRAKYPIKIITGHSDIAPDRKNDPWLFDWNMILGGKTTFDPQLAKANFAFKQLY